ncbi:MAG: hypothetical protein LCH56_10350 [Proteobacteria bacterium]|nr:hypothetical protein [Pseudomonadota bacterium]
MRGPDRVKELVGAAQDARQPNSYARTFDSFVAASMVAREILAVYEQDLAILDDDAWRAMKAAAAKRLVRNKAKGWEPLFDLLNEAKAYGYLRALGCANIQMIPPSYDRKTPDLKAEIDGGLLLCEVKTINMSDDERTVRDAGPVSLSEEFMRGKLTWTLRAAKAQLDAFSSTAARKLIYLVFNPDESLHGYADDYSLQLHAFLTASPLEDIDVEIAQFLPILERIGPNPA